MSRTRDGAAAPVARLAVTPAGPERSIAAHLATKTGDLTLVEGTGRWPGRDESGVLVAPLDAERFDADTVVVRAAGLDRVAGSELLSAEYARSRFVDAVGATIGGPEPGAVNLATDDCTVLAADRVDWHPVAGVQDDRHGFPVLQALMVLGYLPAGATDRDAWTNRSDLPGEALRALQRYLGELAEQVPFDTHPFTVWTGEVGALLGPTVSQSLGQEWCVVTAYSGWEPIVGAVVSAGDGLPEQAALVDVSADDPGGNGRPHHAAPVSRVAWLDTGFIRTPVVPLAQIGDGESIEGPRRVVTPWSACVVPPETVATRVGAALVFGPERWSAR